jgi:tetratricopeptide (TPR) repeat protein
MTTSSEALQKIISEQQTKCGADDPRIADLLCALAAVLQAEHEPSRAESALTRAADIRARKFGRDNVVVAQTNVQLADLHAEQGNWARAEKLYSSSLESMIRGFGSEDAQCEAVREKLRAVLEKLGRDAGEADRFAAGVAFTAMSDALSSFPWDEYRDMGQHLLQIRNAKEAQRVFECLRDVTIALSPNSIQHAQVLELLSDAWYLQDRKDEAFRLREKAGERMKALLGAEHPSVVRFAERTAQLQAESQLVETARRRLEKIRALKPQMMAEAGGTVVAVTTVESGDSDAQAWRELMDEGQKQLDACKYGDAERLFTMAVEKAESFAPGTRTLWDSMTQLAQAYNAGGKLFKASSLFQQVVQLCEAAHGPQSPDVVRYLALMAENVGAQGDFIKERQCYERIVDIYTAVAAPQEVIGPYQARLDELSAFV